MSPVRLNRAVQPDLMVPALDLNPAMVHRRLPGYSATPLRVLQSAAAESGLGAVYLKDESRRLELPAYKVLGAAWATYRVLVEQLGMRLEPWNSVADLKAQLAKEPPLTLVTATDGNHGRGVARVARWLGMAAEVYLPEGSAPSRVAAIAGEGARVVEVPGTYDAAVARAADVRGPGVVLLQDHGWPGYEQIPDWVAEGYDTILAEADEQLAQLNTGVDAVLVQIGVGTLASAVLRHYRRPGASWRPQLIGVEPTGAACALHSIEAGHPVMIHADAHSSIMAGLNCGTPSSAAWPWLRDGLTAFVTVADEQARIAMRRLARSGIVAGESGAAGLAGLMELMRAEHAAVRQALGWTGATRVLLLSTEGATDPEGYQRIVGQAEAPGFGGSANQGIGD